MFNTVYGYLYVSNLSTEAPDIDTAPGMSRYYRLLHFLLRSALQTALSDVTAGIN